MKKRNRNKTRSFLSVILSLTLAMSLMTASVFATEENPEAAGADQAVGVTVETVEEKYTFDEAVTEDPAAGADQTEDGTAEIAEETYVTDEAGIEDSDTGYASSDATKGLTEAPESGDADSEATGDDSLDEEEYGLEVLSTEEQEDEEAVEDDEEDPEIQVFASTEGNQTLEVVQKAEGTIGDDVSFTYHLYQITEAAETIENMGDIISYEPGASLEYVIVETDTGEEISDGTTDSEGTFTLNVGETAEFTLEAETNWFVNQDTPEAYPLISVGSDGEYADVVGGTNGVVYYGQIEPEPVQPVISDVSVTSNLDGNEKTYDGGSVILTADATVTPDTAAVSYQWYKDGVEISGATESTYTLDGNVSDTGTYKCVVTATNDGLTAAAEAEVTVTINKAAQDISYAVTDMEKTLGEEPFTNVLTQTTVSKDDGAGITYASSNESVATVDENGEVTILAAGEVTITATAAATANYTEASASYTIKVLEQPVINGLTITSNLTDNEKTYDGDEVILTANTEYIPDTATVDYQWYVVDEGGNETEITGANGYTLTLTGNVSDSGTYKCVVTVTNDGLTATAEAEITITINKADQDISYDESTVTKIDYDEDFTIDLTQTTVDGQITYTSSDETVATIDSETGEVHIVWTGYTTITATAAETDNYKEATASYVLIVNTDELEWEIDVNHEQVTWDEEHAEWVDDLTYTGEPLEFEMTITLTEEEQEELEGITYQWYRYNFDTQVFDEIDGATEEAYTLEGEDVNAGDYIYMCMAVVTYKNGFAHTVYSPIEVIIGKADQSIVFEEESLTAVAGDTVTNKITEDSVIVGTVTYESSDDSVAMVDEKTGEVTIVGVGTVTITATAEATDNYNAASASYTITVLEKPVINGLTITSNLTDNEKTYDGGSVILSAEATITPDTATLSYKWYKDGDEISGATESSYTLEGNVSESGTYKCIVTATNDGLTTTEEAEITITINKADQRISYEEDEIEKTTADEAFTNPLTETSISLEEGAGITYSSSDESVATVDEDGLVTIVGGGEATITATAVETANYAEATASYKITVMKTWDNVQYAVKLWGICADTYSYDEGATTSVASLTFGPATGADHLDSYAECSSDTCIHKLSWDEIIAYCEQYQGNESELNNLFGSCLENGCTKAVELTPNDTLFNMTTVNNALAQGYTGDGVSTLYYLLNGTGSSLYTYSAIWNYSYTGYSSSDRANIYSRSRIRATLTGDGADAKEQVANGKNDYYGVETLCDESNCLLSCFPANLQAAIVPRTTLNTGNATSGTSANDKTTYDKLFLFSLKETGITYSYDDGGGSDYGVNPKASARVAYEFTGTAATTSSSQSWWSRSRSSYDGSYAYFVNTSGSNGNYDVNYYSGLSPGFCIE